ncbi:unnamed protein product [Adineta steineri]|uniref:G-protein coupled receptors family 1 profile domain-containing protein n=1 Tax=Adineta steineri TaxID=433720 RepID=A0A815HJA1_9BILA|nr:unnamed protein product [Adineta steineri]
MRRRRMSHLSTCYYMGILAVADTSVLLLGLSVMWIFEVNRKWSLLLQSTYICKIVSLLFYTVSDVSVWLVCMMSVDRCIAVARPLHASSICTVRRARISASIVVICIILINIHFLFTHHLSIENECWFHERYEFFSRHIWPWIDAAVYSVLPFILLLTMNLIIVHSLFQARRSTTNLQIYQSQITRQKNKLSMSRKLTTMLLAVNFFLYAITGRAFRHELKRLFDSIAVKMHLSTEPIQKSNDRRTTTININYSTVDSSQNQNQRVKGKRTFPGTLSILQCRHSIDSTASNSSTVPRYFRQQQIPCDSMNDVTYCLQKISNV